ncbi:MAG: hypothetical protein DRI97_16775 [Bacteroidetes bacterium]|nr:MAG: hypothetical protein DRI97_16775 [Bacteroidota bacterium]
MTIQKILSGALLCFLLIFSASCEKEKDIEKDTDLVDVNLKDGAAVYRLFAAQFVHIGSVTITQNFGVIMVTYETTGNWFIERTHFHVEYDWNDIPQSIDGDPLIYDFEYQNTHSPVVQSFSIMLNADYFGRFYIAAYACVEEYNSDCHCEEAWGEGTSFPGTSWGMYIHFYPYNGKNPQIHNY